MKGASAANLPAFLIVGPPGSGKTSVMLHSGLEPELLAGQVYQGARVAPTATLNIWLARQVVFIEISAPFATDVNALKAIVKQLKPRGIGQALRKTHPPRGVLLCMNQEQVAETAVPAEITALARPWNECLSLVAAGLGIQLPVYVLLSKLDGMTGFAEFVSNLGVRECGQALGAATRPFNAAADGAYAEETSRVVNQHFSSVAFALCEGRLPLLRRELNPARIAVGYQFPREFQKLQKNLVQFLVELGRPSQLQVSPFLRGFYFCGTRNVVVDRPGKQTIADAAQPDRTGTLDATTVLSPEQIRLQMAAPLGGGLPRAANEVTEWLFLPSVFEGVLLKDRTAHSVSSSSSRTNRLRTAACAILGVLGLAIAAAFTVSYASNRRLEKDLVLAAKGLADPSPELSAWKRLERMRQPVQRLIDYRSHTPRFMTWGLYPGKDLLGPAQVIYCSSVKSLVLQPLVLKITNDLATVRTAGADPSSSFVALKTYMMMTTHPQYADETFLTGQLLETWQKTPGAAGGAEPRQLLPKVLQLYASLLSVHDYQTACLCQSDPNMIGTAQEYLRSHYDQYQSLLQYAGRGIGAVNYDVLYPNEAVHDSTTVPAWFTIRGWEKMREALDHPAEFLKTDTWVLGGSGEFKPEDPSARAGEYRTRYIAEYQQAWKKYLESASIVPYHNLPDAVAKLEIMSNRRSHLLRLIGLATEHTGSIGAMKDMFQPTSAVAPTTQDFLASDYLTSLERLKTKLSRAAEAGLAHDKDLEEARTAANDAEDSTNKLAASFKGETDQAVKHILLEPITSVHQLLGRQSADAVNGAGKNLCAAFPADTFPFNPRSQRRATLDQIHRLFDRQGGEMWPLYEQSLRDSVICGDTCLEKPSPKFKVQPRFLAFFNSLYQWDRLLESGGQLGRISLSLRALKFNQLKSLNLAIDDQHFSLQAGGDARNIIWDLNSSQRLSLDGEFDSGTAHELFSPESAGRWALFEWLFNSESGYAGEFYWVPKSGTTTRQHFSNNQTKEYKIEIRLTGGLALDRRSLNLGACSSQVSR